MRRAEARAALALEEEIRRGRAGAAEVAAAVETGEVPAAAAAHLEGIAEATAAAEAQRQTGAARVAEVLVGRAPQGDPAEPGFRQAVEAYAESLLPDILASLPPEATARIAAATGVVPAGAGATQSAKCAGGDGAAYAALQHQASRGVLCQRPFD